MPDLPPIGSLWRHRESGERRFVTVANDGFVYFTEVRWESVTTYHTGDDYEPLSVWLAWQANADRIDNAPQGQETT